MSGSLDDVAQALVRLTLAHRDPRRAEPEAALRRWIRRQCAQGAIGLHPHPRAAVLLGARQQRMSGPTQTLFLAVDPGHSEAVDALLDAVRELAPFDPAVSLSLDASLVGMLPALESLGLIPRFVELEGTLSDALDCSDRAEHAGVRMGRPADLEGIMEVRRSIFRAEPGMGFGRAEVEHADAIDAGVRWMVERALSGAGHVAVLEGVRGIGGFAAAAVRGGAPPTANLMVALRPHHRGQNLARVLYEAVLAGLSRMGVENSGLRLIGQTRHPAVQHLAKTMGRWPRAVVMRGSGARLGDRQLASIVGPAPRWWVQGRAQGSLQLRAWHPDHAEALREALDASDAHLRPWVRFVQREPRSLEATRTDLVERSLNHGLSRGCALRFGLWFRSELVGEVLLFDRDQACDGTLECGYWVHVDHTGQGFARQAVEAVARLARILGVGRIRFVCDVRNTASRAIPRALGAELSSVTEAPSVVAGEGPVQLEEWVLSIGSPSSNAIGTVSDG